MIIVDKVQAVVMPETEPLKMSVAARTSTPRISMLQNQEHMELKRSNKHQTNMVSGKQNNSLNLLPSLSKPLKSRQKSFTRADLSSHLRIIKSELIFCMRNMLWEPWISMDKTTNFRWR